MRALVPGLLLTLFAGLASGAEPVTVVFDPGPGYPTYLSHSCGGVQFSGGATGFDASGNVVTQHRFFTSCSGSGRGSKNHYYASVWEIVFLQTGQIVSSTPIGTECSWLQGSPAPGCEFTVDVNATYTWNTALAGTTTVASGYVAYLQTDALPPPPPVIETPAVIGMTERKAKKAIVALGLVPYVTTYVTTSYPPRTVFNQSPAAGSTIAAGAQVHIYVAKPPQ